MSTHKPLIIDGYQLDLSAGITTNQALQHDGTKIKAATLSGGSANELWWSAVDLCAYYLGAGISGNYSSPGGSSGVSFYVTAAATCTGVRFYWIKPSGSYTIVCNLWDLESNTSITSVNASVSAAGVFTATFSGSQSLTAFKRYAVTIWEDTATYYSFYNDNNTLIPATAGRIGLHSHLIAGKVYGTGTGNNVPTNIANTEKYPVMPIYTVP